MRVNLPSVAGNEAAQGCAWPPASTNRSCLEGIPRCRKLTRRRIFSPTAYPSAFHLLAMFESVEEEGVWLKAWRALLGAFDEEGRLKMGRGLPRFATELGYEVTMVKTRP